MEAGTKIIFESTKPLQMELDVLTMRSQSSLSCNELVLYVGTMNMEGGAYVDVSGLGSLQEQGLGAGVVSNGYGIGGGHGGYGGGRNDHLTAGEAYGSFRRPQLYGSGGGGSQVRIFNHSAPW
ncbi:uncharacterized protein LOC144747213 [Ciona intestinalis]